MKRYILCMNPDLVSIKMSSLTERYRLERERKEIYKKVVIPFAIRNNLNYKREEWQHGVSLKKADLLALTLILPPNMILKQDSE